MEQVSITREMDARGGRYVARVEGFPDEAELTFVRTDPNDFIADHTLTPVALRHRGIATQLVLRLVAGQHFRAPDRGRAPVVEEQLPCLLE